MSTKNLLLELARLESVEVVAVGDGDHTAEKVAPWCEIVLNLEDSSGTRQVQLTRHDGELIIEALHEVLHPQDNRRHPAQKIWSELDEIMDYLMEGDPEPEDKAAARAYATALAYIMKPHADAPDINEIRAIAKERWEARQ